MAYANVKQITIDGSQVGGSSGSITDYPLLISGTYVGTGSDPDLRVTGSGGDIQNVDTTATATGSNDAPADLAFYDDQSLTTQYDHEVIKYDSSTGEFKCYVRIPTLSKSANTVLYMFYNDSGVTTSQENVGGTWNSNFSAVYHFEQTSGNRIDSSGNSNTLTDQATVTSGTKIGNSADMERDNNEFLSITNAAQTGMTFEGDFSILTWVNFETQPSASVQQVWVTRWQTGATTLFLQFREGSTNEGIQVQLQGSVSGTVTNTADVSISASTWYRAVVTFDESAGTAKVYLTGSQAGADLTGYDTTTQTSSADVRIGMFSTNGTNRLNGFDGQMDEFFVRTDAVDADYVLTDYNNQNSPGTFYTIGDPTLIADTVVATASLPTPTIVTTRNVTVTPNPVVATGSLPDPSVLTTTGTITLTDFQNYKVFQRDDNDEATVTVAGTYTGTPTTIQYRVVLDGTSTEVITWTTLDASPSGEVFSEDITVPQGGWYNIQVRFSNSTGTNDAGTNKWGVGIVVLVLGQSNAEKMFIDGSDLTANAKLASYRNGTWAQPTANGAVAFGNKIIADEDIPILMVESASSGAGVNALSDAGFGYWLDLTPGEPYDDFLTDLTAIGGEAEVILWNQGSTEAITGDGNISEAQHEADLATLFGRVRSAVTFPRTGTIPIIMAQSARYEHVSAVDADWNNIRNAQEDYTETDANAYFGSVTVDLTMSDNVHLSAASQTIHGQRLAQAFLYILGYETYYLGPRATSFRVVNSNTIDVTITHNNGTDFTPTSAITGFRVFDNGSLESISSAVRADATTVRLTISGTITGTATVDYLAGGNPNETNTISDNSTFSLPLIPNTSINQTTIVNADVVTATASLPSPTVTAEAIVQKNNQKLIKAGSIYLPLGYKKWTTWTTSSRPNANEVPGLEGFNLQLNQFEISNGSTWRISRTTSEI